MQQLTDGILLYHGSYTEISSIDLSSCRNGLDFGKGFYLTSSYQQARNYIPSSIKKNIRRHKLPADFNIDEGRVSIFRFDPNPNLLIHYFNTADVEWLHYVAGNRDNSLFQDMIHRLSLYDIIGGKVADDSTATVLNAYIMGDFGIPGTNRADDFAISGLLPDRLSDQFCFRSLKAIQSLEFVRSDRYGDAG